MNNLDYTSPMLFDDKAYYLPQVLTHVYGLKVAFFVQELHWRLRGVRQGQGGSLDVNGRPWFFRSLNDYVREFSKIKGMGRSTIQSIIKLLTDEGILLKWEEANPKYWGGSRTWFSLNYAKLNEIYDQYLAENQEPVIVGDLEPDLGDEVGGLLKFNKPQAEGFVETQHRSMPELNKHTESSTESTNHREDRPAGAAQSAAPLEQKKTPAPGQSYLKQTPVESRDRSKEKPAASTDNEDKLRPYSDLSELGKFLVALANKGAKIPEAKRTKTLTVNQSATLATPLSFYLDSGEHITISPDELFETDDLFKTWLEREVHPNLRQYAGDVKPIARKTLLKAVTLGRRDFSLKGFYEWRKRAQYRDWTSIEMAEELTEPRYVDDGVPLTSTIGQATPEELAALFADEDETEGSADNNEQE